jgi:anaphase-promoting complex subunit 1
MILVGLVCHFFLQGEIGRRSGGDNVLEREGYAVSAGFSLGLVLLGMSS